MGQDKLWVDVGGRPLIDLTLQLLAAVFEPRPRGFVVVAPGQRWERLRHLAAAAGIRDLALIEGGERRQDSVRAALQLLPSDADIVCVHDAARPLCPAPVFAAVLEAAERCGAATAAVRLVDSVKRIDDDAMVVETLDRSRLVAVQTPQAFARDVLLEAHARAVEDGFAADDDCALVERIEHPVAVVPGDPANIKITVATDLRLLGVLSSP